MLYSRPYLVDHINLYQAFSDKHKADIFSTPPYVIGLSSDSDENAIWKHGWILILACVTTQHLNTWMFHGGTPTVSSWVLRSPGRGKPDPHGARSPQRRALWKWWLIVYFSAIIIISSLLCTVTLRKISNYLVITVSLDTLLPSNYSYNRGGGC